MGERSNSESLLRTEEFLASLSQPAAPTAAGYTLVVAGYVLKRSELARAMRLIVQPGGTVVLTVPQSISQNLIEHFLTTHTEWIERAQRRMSNLTMLPSGKKAYLKHKEEARVFITERVTYWNAHHGFTHGRIAIKNTRRVWGSCSRKGNLNFSYTLLLLPRELADYVIVHELCHLKEHNHSRQFWVLVEKTLPQYRALRTALRTYIR